MARILYVMPTPYLPSHSGGRLRRRQIVEGLRCAGHEVSVHILGTSLSCLEPAVKDARRVRPLRIVPSEEWKNLSGLVREEGIDVLIAAHPSSHDLVPLGRALHIPVVVETQNFEPGIQMMRTRGRGVLGQSMVWLSELMYLRSASSVWTISENDRHSYARLYRLRNVKVMPAVVRVAPADNCPAADPLEVLFIGSYGYRPNVDAARFLIGQVLPRVRTLRGPKIKLVLVGAHPPTWLQASAADDVEIAGEVDDVELYYQRAAIIAGPLLGGGGVKLKILEAMAHAKPIVASHGAVTGLDVRPGIHYLYSEPEGGDFASAIARLAGDSDLRRRLGASASDYVARAHSPAVLEQALRKEMRALVSTESPEMPVRGVPG